MPTDTAPSRTPPDAALLQLVFGRCISMALSVVAKLRVADLLADGPRTLDELATRTGTHAPSLYRVLRTPQRAGFARLVTQATSVTLGACPIDRTI
jgi:hypothetical protein